MQIQRRVTGTDIHYFFICKRKLWLSVHKIDMEHNSDIVAMGKFISDSTYVRNKHELRIDNVVIDYFSTKTLTVHEIKKSNKMEESHIWQVKYYLFLLENKGVKGVKGVINYPKLHKTFEVHLSENDIVEIKRFEIEILNIINSSNPPKTINTKLCKNCSYYELCYI